MLSRCRLQWGLWKQTDFGRVVAFPLHYDRVADAPVPGSAAFDGFDVSRRLSKRHNAFQTIMPSSDSRQRIVSPAP
jgi:hypothetical protein